MSEHDHEGGDLLCHPGCPGYQGVYEAARDPGGNRPGGERVRFEEDASGNAQSIFGGSAKDIERSILEDTAVNTHILGRTVLHVKTLKNDLGAGALTEVEMTLGGVGMLGRLGGDQITLRFVWTDRGLVMAVKDMSA